MLRKSRTANSAARGRTSILRDHPRYHSRLTRFEPLESRQLLTATVIQVTTTADTVDPLDGFISLREAILEANASPLDHEIQLPAGTYTLTRQGANEDAALTGDLDIVNNGSLKIVGAGSATTTIDAGGLFDAGLGYGDRVFDVTAGAAIDLDGLTLTGGSTPTSGDDASKTGGAIRGFGARIAISNSTVSGNQARGGGAIAAIDGALALIDSTLSVNSASGAGGGVSISGIAEFSISGSTFANNSTNFDGGGIAFSGTIQLTITDSTFTGNSAGRWGGAIFRGGSQHLMIANSTFSHNTAGQWGGAIANFHTVMGPTTIIGSSITENSAQNGGGIFDEDAADLIVTNSSISNNSASGSGGGIWHTNSRKMTVTGSSLIGNSSGGHGGGIFSDGSDMLTVLDSTISGNSSTGSGGGIYSKSLRITGSTVAENHAGRDGGGVYCSLASTITGSTISFNTAKDGGGIAGGARIDNSTISGNSALNSGGGVGVGDFRIRNSTITGNRADSNGDGDGKGGGVSQPQSLTNTIVAGNLRGAPSASVASDVQFLSNTNLGADSVYNLIGDPNTAGGLAHGVGGNIVGDGSGNPLDVSTVLDTTLADNGGPTLTHALVPGSPAFNAGDPLFDPNATNPPTLFDQRGAGYARVSGGRVDIGAIESDSIFNVVVSGRHIFYDNSAFDSQTEGANPTDFVAIATGKQPLLPGGGLATSANVTSYSRGINGIMVDLAGSHPDITAADFEFRSGNSNSPELWALAPTPASVTVLAGQGIAGADRVVITWPSGAIMNTWLEVQVLATANTGLAASDVFYWGNKVGDTFTNPGAGTFNTTTADAAQVYAALGIGKPVTDLRDYNRDGQVTTADATLVFDNFGSIVRLNIPAVAAPAVQVAVAVADNGSRAAVAAGVTQRAGSLGVDPLPAAGFSPQRESPSERTGPQVATAITSEGHFEALSATSDALEEILFDFDDELCEPVLAELI